MLTICLFGSYKHFQKDLNNMSFVYTLSDLALYFGPSGRKGLQIDPGSAVHFLTDFTNIC